VGKLDAFVLKISPMWQGGTNRGKKTKNFIENRPNVAGWVQQGKKEKNIFDNFSENISWGA
jgi:hypothetical protein